jgi:hypothetical protein
MEMGELTLPGREASVHEVEVRGEIKTIAAREGSSGKFYGSIEGLYQGHRFGSSEPDERRFELDAPNGTIALVLRQQIVTPLPSRPAEHPFAGDADPFEQLAQGGPPPGMHGGPPPGVHGGPPPGVQGGPPPGVGGGPPDAPGMEGGQEIFKRVHYMEVKLEADPSRSTGIFEGATGEVEIMAPNYRMAGYLVVNTEHGDLQLDFLEKGSREKLDADLSVNGENSTGIWKNARGDLTFSLEVTPPVYGRGPYSGTISFENEPPEGIRASK